jgi:folate-binding protein YgfZ
MQPEAYVSAREHAAVFDVSARGKIEVTGPDAVVFLHNLTTHDIKNLPPGGGCEAFFATLKARVLAHVRIYRDDTATPALWLDIAPNRTAAVLTHLDRYLISEQVELMDHTAELSQLYLVGPESPALVERMLGERAAKLAPFQNCPGSREGVSRIRRNDILQVPGYDILASADSAAHLGEDLLAAGAAPGGPDDFEMLRVEAGLPLDGVDMDENRFVVEVGRANAISYTKGCYLGQEPIVMARDRGHANRTLLGVRFDTFVAPGAKLLREDQEVGVVTSAVLTPRFGVIGLAYVRRGSQESGTVLVVETPAGRSQAVVSELPFTL